MKCQKQRFGKLCAVTLEKEGVILYWSLPGWLCEDGRCLPGSGEWTGVGPSPEGEYTRMSDKDRETGKPVPVFLGEPALYGF